MFNLMGVLGVAIPEVMVEPLGLGIMGAYIVLAGSLVVLALLRGAQTREIPNCSSPRRNRLGRDVLVLEDPSDCFAPGSTHQRLV